MSYQLVNARVWDGAQWVSAVNPEPPVEYPSATGGTETTITVGADTYKVHTFTTSGNFVVTSPGLVQYLVIGGGAGAPPDRGGGGGAGGYRCSVPGENSGGLTAAEPELRVTAGTYAIVVGAGGTGITGNQLTVRNGNDSVFGRIVAAGGGYNIIQAYNGTPGGSGGGAGAGTGRLGGAPVTQQGFAGGNGSNMTSIYNAAGGGGGAGQAGANATTTSTGGGGNGGNGIQSAINGTATYRAGGGGGGTDFRNATTSGAGTGGLGGGGNAASNTAGSVGGNGTANTGSGGGGGSLRSDASIALGGAGGSGIVIIRYKLAP